MQLQRNSGIGIRKSQTISMELQAEAAEILFCAVIKFLKKNKLDSKSILSSAKRAQNASGAGRRGVGGRHLRSILHVYEQMGTIVATWYSNPRFLNKAGNPLPLSAGRGARTIQSLVRASGTKIPCAIAIDLMLLSPTITIVQRGKFLAVSRYFSLPGFELLRAGLVIERFLETLYRNSEAGEKRSTLIFERSCYVNSIGQRKVARLLRDIKVRGSAFMDSVDGQIEANKSRNVNKTNPGELGVFMFAWMGASHGSRSRA
jgi:hypothetical protein